MNTQLAQLIGSNKKSLNKGKAIKNNNLIEFPTEIEELNKWTIPKIQPKEIYQIGTFDFRSSIAIKTMERTVQLNNNEQLLKLLAIEDISPYLDNYNFLHIGLIQIALKPLTLQGLNASLITSLRDGRCLDWAKSLMGVMQTSLCHGPVYFNVYPNLSLSLTDVNLLEAITLNLKTFGYNFLPGSETIAIIYRVHFKILNTLAPKARHLTKPGQTTLVETNLLTSKVATNRIINWEEIQFPPEWTLNTAIPPQPIMDTDFDQIIQSPNGDVEVRFTPQITARLSTSSSRRYSSVDTNDVHSVRMTNTIPHPIYKATDKSSKIDDDPTMSEMSFGI